MRIYCDGVFDLFHAGHEKYFKKSKELFDDPYLIVGINADDEVINYKRKPVYNEQLRAKLVRQCEYVDEVLEATPLVVDELLINKYQIDYVVHAFYDKKDINKQSPFFEDPIRLNKMKVVEYTSNISTTLLLDQLVNTWKKDKSIDQSVIDTLKPDTESLKAIEVYLRNQ